MRLGPGAWNQSASAFRLPSNLTRAWEGHPPGPRPPSLSKDAPRDGGPQSLSMHPTAGTWRPEAGTPAGPRSGEPQAAPLLGKPPLFTHRKGMSRIKAVASEAVSGLSPGPFHK